MNLIVIKNLSLVFPDIYWNVVQYLTLINIKIPMSFIIHFSRIAEHPYPSNHSSHTVAAMQQRNNVKVEISHERSIWKIHHMEFIGRGNASNSGSWIDFACAYFCIVLFIFDFSNDNFLKLFSFLLHRALMKVCWKCNENLKNKPKHYIFVERGTLTSSCCLRRLK